MNPLQSALQYLSGVFQPKTVSSFRKEGFENIGVPVAQAQQVAPQASVSPGILEAARNFLSSSSTTSSRWKQPTNELIQVRDSDVPQPTTMPAATPNPALDNGQYRFAYETLPRDQPWSNGTGPRPNFNPKQPPADIGQIIRDVFPNEATTAAAVAASEDGRFDPKAQNLWNDEGQGIDRGIFAINSNTFNGLKQRQPGKLKELGIDSFEDMFDPKKNAQVAKLIQEGSKQANADKNTAGWGPWYGWQDTGYDINNGWFSKADRTAYELAKGKKK